METEIAVALLLSRVVGQLEGVVILLFLLMLIYAGIAVAYAFQLKRYERFLREKKLLQQYAEWRAARKASKSAQLNKFLSGEA